MTQEMLVRKPSASIARRVTLVTRLERAENVVVTGDFTKWSTTGLQMVRGQDGEWKVALDLPPGEYQYRLLVDGTWSDHAEAARRIPNPFGCENCVLMVK